MAEKLDDKKNVTPDEKDIHSCPICKSNMTHQIEKCDCGYHFRKEEITNFEKMRTFYSQLKADKSWIKQIIIVKSVHEIQQGKYGETYAGKPGGWSYKKTGELLSEPVSSISDYSRGIPVVTITIVSSRNRGICFTVHLKGSNCRELGQSYSRGSLISQMLEVRV